MRSQEHPRRANAGPAVWRGRQSHYARGTRTPGVRRRRHFSRRVGEELRLAQQLLVSKLALLRPPPPPLATHRPPLPAGVSTAKAPSLEQQGTCVPRSEPQIKIIMEGYWSLSGSD